MQNPTKREIDETAESIANIKKAITKAEELEKALADYDKATINKRFFEKYFSMLDEKGEVLKGWKGEAYTAFKFSAPTYSFQKGKRIYINGNYYIDDIETTDRKELLTIVNNWLAKRKEALTEYEKEMTELTAFDETAFKTDLKALWIKYGKPNHWRRLLEDNFYFQD